MFQKPPEVLIVGAGPVGLFAGLHIVNRGHRVRIIDKEWRPTAHSYALALHGETLGLLEDVGLLGGLLGDARRIRDIGFYEGTERFAGISLNKLPTDFAFAAVLRQDQLERVLVGALEERGVKVSWNHELAQLDVDANGVEATVDTLRREGIGYAVQHGEWVVARSKVVKPEFVIGADGHKSRVRRALGIDYPEVGPTRSFAVFEFRTDADLGDEMKLFLSDGLMNVVWPMPDGYCRWSFEVEDAEAPTLSRIKDRSDIQLGGVSYPVLTEESLLEMMKQRAPWFEGSAFDLRWRLLVRFERHLAARFGQDRAWLAGDAGHMTGPVGIQSMNVGLREARDLAHAICDVLDGKADMRALDAYNRARQDEWHFLLGINEGFAVMPEADQRLRPLADELLSCLPSSGAGVAALATQIGLQPVESAVI